MNATRSLPKSNIRNLFASIQQNGISHTKLENPPSQEKPKTKSKTKAKAKPKPVEVMKPYKKKKITGALREAVWIKTMGRKFEGKCPVVWCSNTITVFDFQSGHNIPESKGGSTTLPNLIAICSRCNNSMGNHYTITEWNAKHAPGTDVALHTSEPPLALTPLSVLPPRRTFFQKVFSCFFRRKR